MEGPGPKVFLTKALGQEKATERDVFNLTMPSSTSAKAGASGSASTPGAGPEASWTHLTSKSFHRSPWKRKHRPPPRPSQDLPRALGPRRTQPAGFQAATWGWEELQLRITASGPYYCRCSEAARDKGPFRACAKTPARAHASPS